MFPISEFINIYNRKYVTHGDKNYFTCVMKDGSINYTYYNCKMTISLCGYFDNTHDHHLKLDPAMDWVVHYYIDKNNKSVVTHYKKVSSGKNPEIPLNIYHQLITIREDLIMDRIINDFKSK